MTDKMVTIPQKPQGGRAALLWTLLKVQLSIQNSMVPYIEDSKFLKNDSKFLMLDSVVLPLVHSSQSLEVPI